MNKRKSVAFLAPFLVGLLLAGIVVAAETPTADWWIIGGAGGHVESAGYALDYTVGQPVAGSMDNAFFVFCVGSWCGFERSSRLVYLPLAMRNYFGRYALPCGPGNGYCEPYNSPDDAYGPLAPGYAYSAYADDRYDYYFIELASTGTVAARVVNYMTEGQLCLRYPEEIKDPVCDAESPWVDGEMEVSVAGLEAGQYFIQIWTSGNFELDTLYDLTVSY